MLDGGFIATQKVFSSWVRHEEDTINRAKKASIHCLLKPEGYCRKVFSSLFWRKNPLRNRFSAQTIHQFVRVNVDEVKVASLWYTRTSCSTFTTGLVFGFWPLVGFSRPESQSTKAWRWRRLVLMSMRAWSLFLLLRNNFSRSLNKGLWACLSFLT